MVIFRKGPLRKSPKEQEQHECERETGEIGVPVVPPQTKNSTIHEGKSDNVEDGLVPGVVDPGTILNAEDNTHVLIPNQWKGEEIECPKNHDLHLVLTSPKVVPKPPFLPHQKGPGRNKAKEQAQ